ncbi:MAG: DUF424 family protein [Candidatus Lokiarchaeota archaeon]|nr:DUF424 family protein [Candidatus Lokiarchaeota archaeon]
MKRTVYLKIHAMQGRQFLSCCDSDLLGKSFTEGKCCLRVTEGFYKGAEVDLDEAKDVIAASIEAMDSIQVIGEHIIDHLHACDLVSKECARRTCNVPHLIIVRT